MDTTHANADVLLYCNKMKYFMQLLRIHPSDETGCSNLTKSRLFAFAFKCYNDDNNMKIV